ncbi:MAG: transglutaminase-like cysteine peptidase [Pseudomonadota bacterium]
MEIKRTSFDQAWGRVGNEALTGLMPGAFRSASSPSFEDVETVNRWVNRKIQYVEDRQLFGISDYWAGARLTMALARGDCEDIALTKMQLLAEMGVSRDDMFLTIARDTIRRADHALLVVRIDGRFVVLDNATDTVLDGAYSHDYQPVLSFAQNRSWVHGR